MVDGVLEGPLQPSLSQAGEVFGEPLQHGYGAGQGEVIGGHRPQGRSTGEYAIGLQQARKLSAN